MSNGVHSERVAGAFAIAVIVAVGFAAMAGLVAGMQWVRVYVAEYTVKTEALRGEAELRRAQQNRQIEVEAARAKLDAAEFLNQAEVLRARGLADATAIVADSFGGPEQYLRYLWIQSLENNKANIIYVPTEAGLPILEAGRSVSAPPAE